MFIFFWSNVLHDILMSSSLSSSVRRTSFLYSRVNKATLSHLFVLDELFTCTDFHFLRPLPSSSCDWWAPPLPTLTLKQLITCQPFLRAPNLPVLALLDLLIYLHGCTWSWRAPRLPALCLKNSSPARLAALAHNEFLTCQPFTFWTPYLPALTLDELLTCQPFLRASNLPALALLEIPTYLHLILKSSSPASIVFDELLTCQPLYLMSSSPASPCIL